MVTILGSLILISASSMLGIRKASILRARAQALGSVVTGLGLLKGEICTLQAPIPELAGRLSENAPYEMKQFFSNLEMYLSHLGDKSFFEIWSLAVKSTKELMLKKDEEECLCHLGLSLGRYVLDEQEAVIAHCISRFEEFYNAAREEARVQGKLYTGLGIAGGLMLSVILI